MSNTYRLCNDYYPTHYKIRIKTDIKSKIYEGNIEITFRENHKNDFADLFADEHLIINNVTQLGEKLHFTRVKNRFRVFGDQINLYPVLIEYIGSLDHSSTGFYYINDQMACTQCEATHAREVFPCYDEPCVKSTFELTLVYPKGLVALSNTPASQEYYDGDFAVTQFQKTVLMCSYLFAIAIGDFISVKGFTNRGMPIFVYALPSKKNFLQYTLEECIHYVEWFEEYTQIDFPLPCLQICSVPELLVGAMENFGLIIGGESYSLADPKLSSFKGLILAMSVNCHEISHQWAGNCVSPKWWDDLWLNEGFATLFPLLVYNDQHPEWDYLSTYLSGSIVRALDIDASSHTHSIHCEVHSDTAIEGVFDGICYSKAGWFIQMLMYHIGYEKFQKALRMYFKRYLHSNAEASNLCEIFSEVAQKDMKPFFDNWIHQSGYPIVILDENGILHQKKYTIKGILDGYIWELPLDIIIIRHDNSIEQIHIHLSTKEIPLKIAGEFQCIILNSHYHSICRSIQQGRYFETLLGAIRDKIIDPYNLFCILNDFFDCVKSEIASYSDLIRLLVAFRGVSHPLPGQLIVNIILHLYETFQSVRKEIIVFSQPILEEMLQEIGLKPVFNEDQHLKSFRCSLLSTLTFHFNNNEARQYGIELFNLYRETNTFDIPSDIDLNLIPFMLRSGSMFVEGGNEYVHDTIKYATNPELSSNSVFCSGFIPEHLVDKALDQIWTMKNQDIDVYIAGLCANSSSGNKPWLYFQNHIEHFLQLFGHVSFILPLIVTHVISTIQSENELDNAKSFFDSHPIEIATFSIQNSISTLQRQYCLEKKFTPQITQSLSTF